MEIYEELKRRGLIAQVTNEDAIKELINSGKAIFYIGFDATADSLHVGHFLQFVVINWLQRAGNQFIVLLGTGTTLIGDPTGKTDMRKMLSKEEIDHNANCFKNQMEKYINKNASTFVKNGDWLCDLKYLELLREIGVHFSVNRMLTAECVKTRLERGLSFLEFNYVIMQSYDFLHLNREYGCNLQLGGDDQWSNILGGVDLVRRVDQNEVYGMTFTLLLTSDGKKMGKTEKGALWLDENKLSVYDFFQFWRNVGDSDVFKCLKFLTFLPIEEIEKMEQNHEKINRCKEILAFEVTKLVHGEEKASVAMQTARAVFGGDMEALNMPSLILRPNDFEEGQIELALVLVKLGLTQSKSESRRLIEQGGIKIDDQEIEEVGHKIAQATLAQKDVVIKKGKKVFFKLIFGE
ncbi:tyrosine--tRNA ligase [Clostridia bacterium]|nr:tyrosine--tRNA ligase [Clostridia bacterium]